LRQEHQTHVPMPRGPGAVFVMIPVPGIRFVFLETALMATRAAHAPSSRIGFPCGALLKAYLIFAVRIVAPAANQRSLSESLRLT